MVIIDCGLKEISKNDLKGLEGLVGLWMEYCQLASLPDDLFSDMPNLREIGFQGNQIEFASSNLLKPLIGRKDVIVSLRGNKSIDACYWPGLKSSASLESLEELMKLIDEKCTKPARRTIFPSPANFNPKLMEMWVTGRFSDLTIVAGKEKFKVHKTILGMESEVFAQIFEDQSEATEIKIPDFSSGSVEALLKFIYTNEVSEDGNAKENFDIADKFKVAEMKSIYEEIICDQINEANAWETFLFAHKCSSQLLKEESFQLISNQIFAKKIPNKVPVALMEDPEKLKKLIDAYRVVEEILAD